MLFWLDEDYYVIPDACAFKQIFFMTNKDFAFSSNPNLLSLVDDLIFDDEAKFYLESEEKKDKEYAFPLFGTLYKNVRRLLPNHIYSLKEACSIRMWPTMPIYNINEEEALRIIKRVFYNSFISLKKQFKNLYFSLTAGLDSRIVLFNCVRNQNKVLLQNIKTFTHCRDNCETEDVKVARKISSFLNIEHIKIGYRYFDSNDKNDLKHAYWNSIDSSIGRIVGQDALIIKGSASEICRLPYGRFPTSYINKKVLLNCMGVKSTSFSMKILEEWINGIKENSYNNLSIYDLIYWEHRMGSWQAQNQYESDEYFETFTPFNCRMLLYTILGVKWKKRIPPYSLYLNSIKEEQEFFDIPFNGESITLFSKITNCIKYHIPMLNLIYLMLKHK